TAYSFGDDADELEDYAWYADNSDGELQDVGGKKPNPWGLYDMHGSVAEWVLDGHLDEGYPKFDEKTVSAAKAVVWPTEAYPRLARGGHWDADAEDCRSAARLLSDDEEWKNEDPQLPQSPWWYTTEPSHGVGFRLLRPVSAPAPAEMVKVWEADVDDIRYDVADRLDEGRGALEGVDAELAEAIEQLKQLKAAQ
ncbi:MAG: SUMF1/EgtB/PvdO family nonheme iron enzyme, partial [Planctomycetales bacterium]|nr:SUMF1/EgtB/PvdO family nonheme iron enzyme [Planctomycetales bacterium]